MKLREEDLKRHRATRARPKRRRTVVLSLLFVLVIGGIYIYNTKDSLPFVSQLKIGQLSALFKERNSSIPSTQENINLDGFSHDYISREDLQDLLNNNFARLNTKMDGFITRAEKLQNDVEYVGRLGRSVRRQTTQLKEQLSETRKALALIEQNLVNAEKAIKDQGSSLSTSLDEQQQELEELSLRLEQVDTTLQADTERLSSGISGINQELDSLKATANSLQAASDAHQRSIAQIEQTISILNARLIELER